MSRVLVNIHGAGKQMSDFYKEALTALTAILGTEPACLPCWYADLSNIGSPVRGASSREAIEFRQAFMEQIAEHQLRLEKEKERKPGRKKASAATGTRGGRTRGLGTLPAMAADVAMDVARYLFDAQLQQEVKQRLFDVLENATRNYDETILVSHSLGTVVALDVLHDRADRYKVSRFVTMGSPLRKLVALARRSSDLGAINVTTVPFWRNLYDTTDLVADAIGPGFPDYLIEDVFIQVADLPIPSHDYWRNRQVLNMIAGWLRENTPTPAT
jgi:hypothetical protein